MAGEGDDLPGPQGLGGQDRTQPDGAVADHGHGPPRAGLGGHGPEPPGAQHVGGGQEGGQDVLVVRHTAGDRHEGAVGQGHARVLGLGVTHKAAVNAAGLEARGADLTGVVAGAEGAHHQVPHRDAVHLGTDLDHGAHVLVAHGTAPWRELGVDTAVGPQVRAADTGGLHAQDGVGGLNDVG